MKLQKSATSAFEDVEVDGSDLSPKSKENLHRALTHLQKEKHRLELKVQQLLSRYGDVAIAENIQEMERILEKAIHDVQQRQLDPSGAHLWRQAMSDLRGYLAQYKLLMQTGENAQSFRDAQDGVQQINVMLRRLKHPTAHQGGARSDFAERVTCCVCQDELVNVSMKCGHLLCSTCSQSVDTCPLCRQIVKPQDIRPIFF